jgi:predicted Zn-dependent protease
MQRFPAQFYEWLMTTGKRLVEPIEDLFTWFGNRLFRFSDNFTGVETVALSVGRIILWPVRLCRTAAAGFFELAVPNSARAYFARRLRSVSRRARPLVTVATQVAHALNLDRAALWIAKITKPVWYPIVACCWFAQAWINTRSYKRLALAVPVFAILLMLPLLKGWMWYRGDRAAAARYRIALATAQEQRDFARVHLFERKLAQLGQDTRLSEFNTAKLLERDGKTKEAYERMQRLAPLGAPGYPLAHYWILQHLLQKKIDVPTDEAYRLARIHLDLLAKLGAKGPELDLMEANCLVHENRAKEASALLKPLIYRNRAAAVERLRIDVMLNFAGEARQDAMAVREQMQKLSTSSSQSLTARDYQYWTMAEGVLGDSKRSSELLAEWIKLDPANKAAKKQMAGVYLREFQQMLNSPDADAAELALRLQKSFELNDPPEAAKEQLAVMYQQKFANDVVAKIFDCLYSTPKLPPNLAELMGTSAAVSGEWDRAETWLRQALRDRPNNAAAWNNLACVLLQHSNPPLQEALAAASKAVEADNDDYRFRQTRGQILLRLQRYQESVSDLEYALNGMPDVATIHQSLAKAYDALGNRQLADFHQLNAN